MLQLVRESAQHNGLEESIEAKEGHSTKLSFSEEEKAEVIVSETFGVLLLQEGCLGSLAHANQQLLRPRPTGAGDSLRCVPRGGAQMLRLLSSTALRDATGGRLPEEMNHLARWRDTGRVNFSAPGGFCVNALPDASWMSERISILEVDFTSSTEIPASREFVVHALQDGYLDAVVTSWEVWADQEKTQKLTTHAEDTKDQPWGFARDAHWGQGFQFLDNRYVTAGEELRLTVRWTSDGSLCQFSLPQSKAQSQAISDAAAAVAVAQVEPFECLWFEDAAIPMLCDTAEVAAECDRQLCGDDRPANFVCDEFLKTCRSIVVQTLNDDYFAFLNHQGRLNFFRSALQSLAEKTSGRCLHVLDLGAGAGQLSLFALQALPNAKVLALEACSEFCGMAKETLNRAGYADAVQVQHALSCCVELSENDAVDVVLCEPYDIFLTGDSASGSLDYLIDARQRLAVANVEIIPSGGAQFVRLLMSSELGIRGFANSENSVSLQNLAPLVDSISLMSSRKKGFRWNSLPDLVLMSSRVQLFELNFHELQRKHIPRKRSVDVTCLHDGYVDVVVTSWEVWAGPDRKHRFATHAEETREEAWGFINDVVFGQGLQLLLEEGSQPRPFQVKAGEVLTLTAHISEDRDMLHFTLKRGAAQSMAAKRPKRTGNTMWI